MLKKEDITNVLMGTDDWFMGRLGKFTSSEIHHIMGARGIGEGGKSYIYRKLGEELCGKPQMREVSTEATQHGNEFEPENLRMFGNKMGIDFLVVQKLVAPKGSKFASTPDALIVEQPTSDGLGYIVKSVEAKCPLTYDNYIRLWKCQTPEDVKKEESKYFYQVIHQMLVCNALVGYLSVYHPYFKAGNLRIIEFRKLDLIPEFKLMEQRQIEAMKIFFDTREEMLNS